MGRVLLLVVLSACRQEIDELPDHDGDGIVDIYDSCPTKYDPQADDGDGDGVGDACDPHVTTAGDELITFTFFDHELGQWVPDTIDHWSIDGSLDGSRDRRGATTVGDADATLARLELDTDAPRPTIELSFAVKDLGPSVARRDNQVFLRAAIGGNNVGAAVSNRDDGNPNLNVIGVNSDLDQAGVSGLEVGTLIDLRMTFDAAGTHCTANETVYSEAIPAADGSSDLHGSITVSGLQATLRNAVVYAQRL